MCWCLSICCHSGLDVWGWGVSLLKHQGHRWFCCHSTPAEREAGFTAAVSPHSSPIMQNYIYKKSAVPFSVFLVWVDWTQTSSQHLSNWGTPGWRTRLWGLQFSLRLIDNYPGPAPVPGKYSEIYQYYNVSKMHNFKKQKHEKYSFTLCKLIQTVSVCQAFIGYNLLY